MRAAAASRNATREAADRLGMRGARIDSSAGLARMPGGRSPCSRALLFLHLRQRQSGADGDHIENGMCGIGGQAQAVQLLPGANTNVGRIGVRTLLGELPALPFLSQMLFVRRALGGRLDEWVCGRRCHALRRSVSAPTGYRNS